MGEKYLIQGGNKVRMTQIPMGKYTIEGENSGITSDQVKQIGDALGVNWNDVSLDQLYQGTLVEANEHQDIVGSNTEKALRIALAHLQELPDYYTRLEAMEGEGEKEDFNKGRDVPGKRDGTGPYRGSFRARIGTVGRRRAFGIECPISIPKVQSGVNQMRYEADEDVSSPDKVKLSELLPCPYNREIDKNKIEDIKQAIKETGEIKPFVVTEVNTDNGKQLMITDGHHRYLALKEMDKDDIEVPVVMADEEGVDSAKDEDTVSLGKGGPGSGRFSDDVSGVKLQVARHLRRQGVITRKKK